MKKNIVTLSFVIISSSLFSQIGINTTNPQGTLHIDGAKDNPETGTPTVIQQSNDFIVTQAGEVGIGTSVPTAKLEVNSGISNVSGLRLTHLDASTPISAGTTLGVDASGNVVTVQGSSFVPSYGSSFLDTSVSINTNAINYNLLSFTLPTAGTYLVIYTTSGEINTPGGWGSLVSFLCTAPSAGNILSGSEILIISSEDNSRQSIGSTGTGMMVISTKFPKTFYLGAKAFGINGAILSNSTGYTHVKYLKIAP